MWRRSSVSNYAFPGRFYRGCKSIRTIKVSDNFPTLTQEGAKTVQ